MHFTFYKNRILQYRHFNGGALGVYQALLYILILTCFSSASYAQSSIASDAPEQSTAPEPTKILILGDSLSAAYKLSEQQGWVYILEQKLLQSGHDIELVNASVSGLTIAGGQQILEKQLSQQKPDIILLELGANDGLQGKPIKLIHKALSQLVQLAKTATKNVILVEIRLPPNRGKRYTEPFLKLYKQVTQEQGTALTPFLLEGVAGNTTLMMSDGLHPNAEGQKQIAETVKPYLVKAIERAVKDAN